MMILSSAHFSSGGVFGVKSAGGSLSLDGSQATTLQELTDLADAYWTDWGDRAKRARQA
jgi:hypothetical protein